MMLRFGDATRLCAFFGTTFFIDQHQQLKRASLEAIKSNPWSGDYRIGEVNIMCQQLQKERINTLKTIVMEMSQFQLKTVLIWILDGSDIEKAIDVAMSYKVRD